MLQRMFEPFAGAKKLENGGLFLEVTEADVAHVCDEETARKQFEVLKEDGAFEDEDGSDELRVSLGKRRDAEDQIEMDALREKMEAEFSSFIKGEKYDYVTDMRKAYAHELATPMAHKIYKTLPDHVFWDIKKPLVAEEVTYENPYNPGRAHYNVNFFEARKLEQWHRSRKDRKYLEAGVSHYGNY